MLLVSDLSLVFTTMDARCVNRQNKDKQEDHRS